MSQLWICSSSILLESSSSTDTVVSITSLSVFAFIRAAKYSRDLIQPNTVSKLGKFLEENHKHMLLYTDYILLGAHTLNIIIISQGGHMILRSILFQGNDVYNLQGVNDKVFGGGRAYIFLGRSPTNQSAPRTFLFWNCTFKNNTAHTEHYTFVYNLCSGYGRGGGLYVYISDGLKNESISFIACKFISNRAFIGGGWSASVNIQSKRGYETQNTTVKIIDTVFQGNGYGGEWGLLHQV